MLCYKNMPYLSFVICNIIWRVNVLQRENESSLSDVHDTDYDPNDSFHQLTGTAKRSKLVKKQPRVREEEEEVASSFSVLISVERAMHLPRVSENNR